MAGRWSSALKGGPTSAVVTRGFHIRTSNTEVRRGSHTMQKLIGTLKAVGKATEIYESPDGSKIVILPYGGRILGLFAPQSEENFFWTNAALANVELARAFYESDDWHNSGGDRTWLAPEADVFFPNFPKLDKYFQPRQLDPGNYRMERTAEAPQLVNDLYLTLTRSQRG